MGASMSKEEKEKILNEKFFGKDNNIFTLKEIDFANTNSMPFYDIIIHLQTQSLNTMKDTCPAVSDMFTFCQNNISNQLSEVWKNKWFLMTDKQKMDLQMDCNTKASLLLQSKDSCDKMANAEIKYSMELFRTLFDLNDLYNIKTILLEEDIHNYIDNNGKIDDKNKVIQNAFEYAANRSQVFNNSIVVQMLRDLLGKDNNVNVNTVIYFAENFLNTLKEVAEKKKLNNNQKGGMMVDEKYGIFTEVFAEIKNKYLKHIAELKMKSNYIVNNLQSVTIKDFESESHAPYYNEVKNMGVNYSFGLFVQYLPEYNTLFRNISLDMNQNPEDFFNINGKIIDKKRKLLNHIDQVLNNSQSAKLLFKKFFNLINIPSLELGVSVLKSLKPNMSLDERIKSAKEIVIYG